MTSTLPAFSLKPIGIRPMGYGDFFAIAKDVQRMGGDGFQLHNGAQAEPFQKLKSLSTRVPSHEDMLSMAAALFESEAQDDLSAGKMAYAWFGKANPLGVPCMVVAMPGTVSDASDCLYLTNRKTPAFRPGMQG